MRPLLALLAFAAAAAQAQQPFTLQQILSAPYALSLTAAPIGDHFAWVENAEGRRNLWIGSAHEAARQLTHYTEDDGQDIDGLAWSPDGNAIAYVYGAETGNSGTPANPAHLQHVTPVGIWLQPLTPDAEPKLVAEGHAPLFTRDGRSVLFLRSGKIWITDIQIPAPQQLVFDRGIARSLTLSPDGSELAFISAREGHSFIGLFDLHAHALRFLAPSTGSDSAPTFSRDGKQIAWLRAPFTKASEFAANRTSPYPWSIQLADVSTGIARTVFSAELNKRGSVLPHVSNGPPQLFFTADNHILFFSEADGWVHLYSLDPSNTRPLKLLTPGKFEVEDVVLDPEGSNAYYASNQSAENPTDLDRRHIWQLKLQSPTPPISLAHTYIETHPQVAADGSLSALVSDDRMPMHVARLVAGAWLSLNPVRRSTYPSQELVTPQQVIFKAVDSLQLHGQLFLPKAPAPAGTKRPAILFFHGGPERQMLLGYPTMDYYSNTYAMNQYLASRGYIVLSVNYRGGIGYGLDFRQCEHCGADGAAEYNDVLAAAAYLRSRPDVDTAHIGVWGGSYGGYLTALALARNSDLFAAGVDIHGIHEWSRENNSADWLHGTPAEQERIAAVAHASSPIADVAKWRSPVLLIHGDDDPSVAYAQTPILADALRAQGVHVEELIFPDEVHGFILHKDWLAAFEAAADFFDRTLKPPFHSAGPK